MGVEITAVPGTRREARIRRRLWEEKLKEKLKHTNANIKKLSRPNRGDTWDYGLEKQVSNSNVNLAARKTLDSAKTSSSSFQLNAILWTVAFAVYGESPYAIFSQSKKTLYLHAQSLGGTNPLFTEAVANRLIGIICHPFFLQRPSSDALRLLLQFAVVVRIGARTGWSPPPLSEQFDHPVFERLRKEMSSVLRTDCPTESIYQRFTRLSQQHPRSPLISTLSKLGEYTHRDVSESGMRRHQYQRELVYQQGICAVSIHEISDACLTVNQISYTENEMQTDEISMAVWEFSRYWRRSHYLLLPPLMKKVWLYESCISHRSQNRLGDYDKHTDQQNGVSEAENIEGKTVDAETRHGQPSTPENVSSESPDMNAADHDTTVEEYQIKREIIIIDTDDDMDCCTDLDNTPDKSLADVWMDENPFEL